MTPIFSREPNAIEFLRAQRAVAKLKPGMGEFTAAEIVKAVIDALAGVRSLEQ